MASEMSVPTFCAFCVKVFAVETDPDGKGPCPECGRLLEPPSASDVFISYASPDIQHARLIAQTFAQGGISYWIAPEEIDVGESFSEEIPKALAAAKVVVLVLSSHAVSSPWVDREITLAVKQKCLILPLKIERFTLTPKFEFLLSQHQWEDIEEEGFATVAERVVARVRDELCRLAATPSVDVSVAPVALSEPPLEGVNPELAPYVGPRPFPEVMADRFFGRHHEAEALLRLIARSRLVLLYAPSGAGKSSLLNTVVAQSLRSRGFEVLLDARLGAALPAGADPEDIDNVFAFSVIYGLDGSAVPHRNWTLSTYLRSIRRSTPPGRVIVLDQFEELFTQHPEQFDHRPRFFAQLAETLHDDPHLRLVLAARQEYLADVDALAQTLPRDLALKRFALKRLTIEGALEAVTRPAAPYAVFAPGVAEELVRQLNTIQVRGSDGRLIEKPGEFIEMVHLQIVCGSLWGRLPAGITRIEMEHINRAAGEGQTLATFVANALTAFYDGVVERVATSSTTVEHGSYSPELIRLGCMKFLTPAGTRTMLPRENHRTGRLPDWIVEQLENSHLLRAEDRGGQRWYELSHDRLVPVVGRQVDRKVTSLLFAADLLDTVLRNARQENNGTLLHYFGEHRDVLVECQPFHGQSGLFDDESEFIFRASLASGEDMAEWSRRLEEDFPETREHVLRDALSAPDPGIRRHAAALLATHPVDALSRELVTAAMTDPDASVRNECARSLARLDEPELFKALLDEGTRGSRSSMREALARVRITADGRVAAPTFEWFFDQLRPGERADIRRRAWRIRLRERLWVASFVFFPAAFLAAVAAAAFKWLPASQNWALTQATPSAAMGVFHGIVAGVIWAGLITLGISFYHVVFGREWASRSLFRPFSALVAGLVSGWLSSALVVLVVIAVYEPPSLSRMAWLTDSPEVALFRPTVEIWRQIFLDTRFGWVHMITGLGLGLGMALAINGLRSSPEWNALLARQSGMAGVSDIVTAGRQIARVVRSWFWPVPLMLAVAAVCAFFIPDTRASFPGDKASARAVAQGLIGDCMTQTIGSYFGIVGMGIGIVIMRRGFQIEPRHEYF